MSNATEIANWRRKVSTLRTNYDHACRTVGAERNALATARALVIDAATAARVARDVGQAVQQAAHGRIGRVVCRCLEAVFDEPYEFRIIFEQKRGQTEARLVFVRDGEELDPTRAAGGGPCDVAAFALRLAALVLGTPPRRRVMILDEPFKFVSAAYRDRCRQMVEALAREMRVQFIIITHITELQTGFVFEVE